VLINNRIFLLNNFPIGFVIIGSLITFIGNSPQSSGKVINRVCNRLITSSSPSSFSSRSFRSPSPFTPVFLTELDIVLNLVKSLSIPPSKNDAWAFVYHSFLLFKKFLAAFWLLTKSCQGVVIVSGSTSSGSIFFEHDGRFSKGSLLYGPLIIWTSPVNILNEIRYTSAVNQQLYSLTLSVCIIPRILTAYIGFSIFYYSNLAGVSF
jgi:hypothetical protein